MSANELTEIEQQILSYLNQQNSGCAQVGDIRHWLESVNGERPDLTELYFCFDNLRHLHLITQRGVIIILTDTAKNSLTN